VEFTDGFLQLGNRAMKSFADLTGTEKLLELLRWLAVLPAAVLANLAPRFLAGFMMSRPVAQPLGVPPLPVSDFQRYVLSWLFGLLMGALFVFVGAKTAPRFRPATAVVLAFLWTLYAFLIHIAVHLGQGVPHYTHFAIGAGGAVGTAAYLRNAEKSKGA
jgi:hypothetical protein